MVKTIGIVGAGTMGSGIDSASALKGCRTVVYDVDYQILEKAKQDILKSYNKLIAKKLGVDESKKVEAISELEYTSDFNALSQCDFIIEAAVENIAIKKDIFGRLDLITDVHTVLATNTSSLSVTTISLAVKNDKSRVVGMHFFNPANRMKLVEIVRGEFTSESSLNEAIELSKLLGKTPVVCRDTPAFIVNRIARPFYLEALRILEEAELEVESIDRIMREEGGFKMGPFELMDLIGID